MSYRQEMNSLSNALHKLLLNEARVPVSDIRAAVAGHASLVSLLQQLDHDLAIEHRTVSSLAYRLSHQPRVTDQPLTDVLASAPVSPAGSLWRDVARHATIAQHEWQQSTFNSRPHGEAAWSEIVDVACMAESIAVLNTDIADSLNDAARWRDAASYRADQSSLVVAARALRHHAAVEALPHARELQTAVSRRVMIALTPEHLPEALHRLGAMVGAAENLPPGDIDLIVRTLGETAMATASVAEKVRPAGAAALREHAKRLAAATGLARRIGPLHPGDGKALAQAREITRLLTHVGQGGVRLTISQARDAARAIPEVTKALATSAEWQLHDWRWAVRSNDSVRPWTFARKPEDTPTMIYQLKHAAKHADTLARELTVHFGTQTQRPQAPRDVLAQPLAQRSPWPTSSTPIPLPQIAPRQR